MVTKASPGVALITGASTGIGSVYADRLARRGYDLVLVARNGKLLQALATRIKNQTGRAVEVIAADLSDTQSLATVESRLRSDANITLLLNNAGVASAAPLADSDADQMSAMIALNVTALTRLTQAVIPGFIARKSGAIINIASIVAVAPELLNGVYGGSKAFVLAFSQSLLHELGSKGIRVQAVLPGATRTPLWTLSGVDIDSVLPGNVMTAEDMVDASLVAFDNGEFATIPALPNIADWNAFESARQALMPNLSKAKPAARYAIPTSATEKPRAAIA
jgi:short-subunit dehydrogenase